MELPRTPRRQNVRQNQRGGIRREKTQQISVKALNTGVYDKQDIHVNAGQPVEFSFSADPNVGCGRQLLIPEYNANLVSKNGETQKATFTQTKPGQYSYHCCMNMFHETLIVQ